MGTPEACISKALEDAELEGYWYGSSEDRIRGRMYMTGWVWDGRDSEAKVVKSLVGWTFSFSLPSIFHFFFVFRLRDRYSCLLLSRRPWSAQWRRLPKVRQSTNPNLPDASDTSRDQEINYKQTCIVRF